MLTGLQQEVRRILAGLAECEEFALAGGAALIVSGISDRPTNDLDFFAPYPQTVDALLGAAQKAFEDARLRVERLAEGATFARLRVERGHESTLVDLASDARMLPARSTETGLVLAEAELAADKVLALAGRRETRDFVDFQGLLGRFGIDQLCKFAAEKDLGFAPGQLEAALGYFDRIPAGEFSDYTDDYDGLRNTVQATRRALAACEHAAAERKGGIGH